MERPVGSPAGSPAGSVGLTTGQSSKELSQLLTASDLFKAPAFDIDIHQYLVSQANATTIVHETILSPDGRHIVILYTSSHLITSYEMTMLLLDLTKLIQLMDGSTISQAISTWFQNPILKRSEEPDSYITFLDDDHLLVISTDATYEIAWNFGLPHNIYNIMTGKTTELRIKALWYPFYTEKYLIFHQHYYKWDNGGLIYEEKVPKLYEKILGSGRGEEIFGSIKSGGIIGALLNPEH